MCYHFKQPKGIKQIAMRFNVEQFDVDDFEDQTFNGFAHPLKMIITDQQPKKVELARWGLLPEYVKDENAFKTNTLNARIEDLNVTLYNKYQSNRCLIIVEEFYEWQHINNEKFKYRIFAENKEPFAFAGIYSSWNGLDTFSIVMTEANDLMAEIHNSAKRMPVVLLPEEEHLWLAGEKTEPYKNRKEVRLVAEPLDNLPLQLF